MSAGAYQFTLIHGDGRIVRNIIAHSTVQAMLIGLRTSPHIAASPAGITCKPTWRITNTSATNSTDVPRRSVRISTWKTSSTAPCR